MKTWELNLARRAALFSLLLVVGAFVIVAVTDEGATFATRLDRTAVIVPLLSAFAAGLALRGSARARGELRALQALGASDLRTARGAALGSLWPVIFVLFWGARSSALADAFLPGLPSRTVELEGGAFVDRIHGLSISTAMGTITKIEASSLAPLAHHFYPWLAVFVVMLSGFLVLRATTSETKSWRRESIEVSAFFAATVFAFHLAGGDRIALPLALVPALAFGGVGLYRSLRRVI